MRASPFLSMLSESILVQVNKNPMITCDEKERRHFLKPQLKDQTFLSNIVFVTQNVWSLNGQTMFDQTWDNGKPFKWKDKRGAHLVRHVHPTRC